MIVREASCSCGKIRVRSKGEPVRISVCHRLERQKRTGSAFGAQARFLKENVEIPEGEPSTFVRVGDEGGKATFRFCPRCGSTVWRETDAEPDRIAVTLGAFADPSFPPPRISVYEERKRAWVEIRDLAPVEHIW